MVMRKSFLGLMLLFSFSVFLVNGLTPESNDAFLAQRVDKKEQFKKIFKKYESDIKKELTKLKNSGKAVDCDSLEELFRDDQVFLYTLVQEMRDWLGLSREAFDANVDYKKQGPALIKELEKSKTPRELEGLAEGVRVLSKQALAEVLMECMQEKEAEKVAAEKAKEVGAPVVVPSAPAPATMGELVKEEQKK